jgi:hypothetical protein
MLDGTMCAGCGEFLHDGEDGPGYPGYCSSCAPDYEETPAPKSKKRKPEAMVQSIADHTISKAQKAHSDLYGRPLSADGRKRLFASLKEALSPHILPPDDQP